MKKEDSKSPEDDLHGWSELIADLARRRALARSMGGEEKLARRRAAGQLNARQRIEGLLDPESFREIGTLAGGVVDPGDPPVPSDGFPAGFGTIEGRPVLVGAEDFTVLGGSIGLAAADKRTRLTQLSAQERVPLVFILEGVVMGPSAGHGALSAPLMDFVVMSEGASLFTAGPPLVKAATGEDVTKGELGGPDVHVRTSGVAHNRAATEQEALAMARRYLRYFPSDAWEPAPSAGEEAEEGAGEGAEGRAEVEGERRLDEILALISPDPRKPYKMRRVLELLVDADSLFVVQPEHGTTMITALAFLAGRSVAIVANDPMSKAGSIDRDGALKAARFLEIAGSFQLPVIFLADNPGVLAGSAAEREGTMRAAARMFAAQHRLPGPKLHVTLRKAFGFGSSIMAMNPFDDQTISLAFPGAILGAMPARGGGDAAKADAALQQELDSHELGGPYRVASTMGFDEVIDPRELRNALLSGLRLAARRAGPAREPWRRIGILP